jgi:hypothetical protein
MNAKPPKKAPEKGLSETEAAEYRNEDVGLSEAEWDAWGERNKDALQASFDKAREDLARGHYYALEEVMAELKAQAEFRQSRKAR